MPKIKTFLRPVAMAGLLFLLVAAPTATRGAEKNSNFILELTHQIFKRTEAPGAAKRRVTGELPYSRNRKFLELLSGENIEFTALPTKPEWEEKLIPIRIPIRKGLQGYRLFFINRQDQNMLSKVSTLEDLKKLPTGSGSQWSTTASLEAAGFTVMTAPGNDELFKMLGLRRFITFSRGIDEIYFEHAQWVTEYPFLAVEQEIALFFPHPIYYFVTPKRPDLAERIERGLRGMISDGSFDRLFLKYYSDDIARARLDKRTVISIPNPLLGPQTPLDDPSLWLNSSHIFGAKADEGTVLIR
ncbi:hypothetical protein [Roseibium sp.]|uniref:hypothetical protein n=1 Tax=Roseibium sp. TaxID=1936156 RepID=UPI003264D2AC